MSTRCGFAADEEVMLARHATPSENGQDRGILSLPMELDQRVKEAASHSRRIQNPV